MIPSRTVFLAASVLGWLLLAAPAAAQIPGADARVSGTPDHATRTTVPCSVGPDAPGSARCSFGVVRRGAGQADVHLAEVGFHVSLHKDHTRVLRFSGATVSSADAKEEKMTATKNGDTWCR